jgi:hypothetical protein
MAYRQPDVFNPSQVFKSSDRRRKALPAWTQTIPGCGYPGCGSPATRVNHLGSVYCSRHLVHAVRPPRFLTTEGFDQDTLDAMAILGFSDPRDLSPSSITNRHESTARLLFSSHGGDMDSVARVRLMIEARDRLLGLFGVTGSSRD